MELVARLDASDATQQMLLDDFFQGFLFQIVCQKWTTVIGKIFYLVRAVEATHLACVLTIGFMMKRTPDARSPWVAAVLCFSTLT